MRIALSILLLLHGIAHLPGFLVSWRLMESAELPYGTSILDGTVNVGDAGMRFIGALWLVAGLGCILAAAAAFRDAAGWPSLAFGVVTASLFLCVVAWPVSRIGLALNAVLIIALFAGTHFGWLTARAV